MSTTTGKDTGLFQPINKLIPPTEKIDKKKPFHFVLCSHTRTFGEKFIQHQKNTSNHAYTRRQRFSREKGYLRK